jgi:hypothetical protein
MRLAIESQSRGSDHMNRNALEIEVAMSRHPRDTLANDWQRVLG